jgi:hypothetical protein
MSLFWARHICTGFQNHTPTPATPSERIGHCTRMCRFLVRFIRPDSFVHTRSSAGFTITTSEFEFSVHTAPLPGSIAAAAWLKTGSASTERLWHSYASHQFASCSENFAIRPEVSGRTLTLQLFFLRRSESMGNHDSEIVDADADSVG